MTNIIGKIGAGNKIVGKISGMTNAGDVTGMVKKVNDVLPDVNGNVTLPIPEVDTSLLATKVELAEVANSIGVISGIEVRTNDPVGDDLYEGRIWIRKTTETVVFDFMSQTGDVNSGAAAFGTYSYKSGLNYKPTTSMLAKEIKVKFKTGVTGGRHTTSNPIRCRICGSTGTAPNESNVYGTAFFSDVPIGNIIVFEGTFRFETAVPLLANTQYHFVFDIPSGTGSTYCQTFVKTGQPTDDPYSHNTNTGSWDVNDQACTPTFRLTKVE